MKALDGVAQRYGVTPSELMKRPAYEWCFDYEVAARASAK